MSVRAWHTLRDVLERWERDGQTTRGDWIVFLCWAVGWSVQALARFATADDTYLSYFADDFFYYVVPAEQLIATGTPSFDGVVPTSGFQPLWFGVITVLLAVTRGPNRLFFVAVTVTTIGLLVLCYALARRIALHLLGSALLATCCAFFFIVGCSAFSGDGMELPLVVCLGLTFIWLQLRVPFEAQTRRQLLLSGLVASLMVLARLDAALLVIVYLVMLGIRSRLDRGLGVKVATFTLGGVLAPIYLLASRVLFGSALPISAVAKCLKRGWTPVLAGPRLALFGLHAAVGGWWGVVNVLYLYPFYAAVVVGLVRSACERRGAPSDGTHGLLPVLLLFPVVFLLAQVLLSDWIFWAWYIYPLFVAWPLVLAAFIRKLRSYSRAVTLAVCALWLVGLPAAVLGGAGLWRGAWSTSDKLPAARRIARFMETQPGTYAMGDRAGTVRFLSRCRVVQTEGLMMDAAFLQHIMRQQDLLDVLRRHGVRYYVVATHVPPRRDAGGCLVLHEPSFELAGPSSRRMTGRLCRPPLYRHEGRDKVVQIFDLSLERR